MVTTRRRVGAYRWELAMLAVTAVWGSTFVLVRDAVAQIPPFTFIAYRFLAAALLLAAIRPRLAGGGQPGLLAAGAAVGLALFAGYGFQTVGLQYTTASNAGFITGLSVVLTPLFAALLLRQPPGRWPVVGALVAAAGLACCRCSAWRSATATRWCSAARSPSPPTSCCSAATPPASPPTGWPSSSWHRRAARPGLGGVAGDLVVPSSAEVWVALAITSVVASAAAFLIQTRAQREVSPTRTAVIFTMEPVFAGLFGFLLAGERLSGRGWLGAGLILAGMLVAELGGRQPAAPGRPATDGGRP